MRQANVTIYVTRYSAIIRNKRAKVTCSYNGADTNIIQKKTRQVVMQCGINMALHLATMYQTKTPQSMKHTAIFHKIKSITCSYFRALVKTTIHFTLQAPKKNRNGSTPDNNEGNNKVCLKIMCTNLKRLLVLDHGLRFYL